MENLINHILTAYSESASRIDNINHNLSISYNIILEGLKTHALQLQLKDNTIPIFSIQLIVEKNIQETTILLQQQLITKLSLIGLNHSIQ